MDHLCIGQRETDSLASRYKCISSPRHDSVSSFVFGGEAENQISRRPPSSIPPLLSRLIVKVPNERAKLHILRKKERKNERTRWRFPNVPLSPVPSLLPSVQSAKGDGKGRAARPPTEECRPSRRPSINAASSPFLDTSCMYVLWLIGWWECLCYVYPQGL